MNIRYVVSTMVFWWREHNLSFEQECDFLRSLGFGVELWPTIKGNNDCRYDQRNWTRLKNATEGMLVAMHSRNDGPTLGEWKEQILCAKMLEAPIIADPQSLCVSDKLGIADWGFMTDVVNIAADNNVDICVETGSLAAMLQIGEMFESVGYCLDTGFAHIDKSADFKEYVDQLAARTSYLHLTDNYGRYDDHEPPGAKEGMPRENWDYLLDVLSANGNDVIGSFEMFPPMPGTMIRQGMDFMFGKLNWPNKPESIPEADENTYRPM
jgi:sugar phosphate isomerase/epimerase